jgi:hypothetical protein
LVVASLQLEYKEILQSSNCHAHHVLITQNRLENEEDMGLELERGVELFTKKIETKYHSSSSCVF